MVNYIIHFLGTYGFADSAGYLKDDKGNLKFTQSVLITGVGSVIGHYLASPFFLVKTQLQSQAVDAIAVGHQHNIDGSFRALINIFKLNGVMIIVQLLYLLLKKYYF